MEFHQTAVVTEKGDPGLVIKIIEVAAFAAIAAIGKSLGDTFQERLRARMGSRVLEEPRRERERDRDREPPRRPISRRYEGADDNEVIRRYKF